MYVLWENSATLRLEEVATLFEEAIDTYYVRTPNEPDPFDLAMGNTWYRDGQPITDVIAEMGDTTEELAEDIRELLHSRHSGHEDYEMGTETEFDPESYYENAAIAGGELNTKWSSFERGLKSEFRYFSNAAARLLGEVFCDLEQHRTYGGGSVIVDAGPNTTMNILYRARVFQSDKKLSEALERPEISIGPPPPVMAGAGRMNARGIPVFYGATHPEVALAEVRPPVGSKVVVAQFDVTRPLRLLDVEALQRLSVMDGSPFDPDLLARQQKASFLSGLSERITMPVMPEEETFDYIATQVIADYLASLESPCLDGMIYPSVQAAEGMKNVVLFHKAAVVAKVVRREDVKFTVSSHAYDHNEEIEYSVLEEYDSEAVCPPVKELSFWELITHEMSPIDTRRPSLALCRDNVHVHHIRRVAITSDEFLVSRREFDLKNIRSSSF